MDANGIRWQAYTTYHTVRKRQFRPKPSSPKGTISIQSVRELAHKLGSPPKLTITYKFAVAQGWPQGCDRPAYTITDRFAGDSWCRNCVRLRNSRLPSPSRHRRRASRPATRPRWGCRPASACLLAPSSPSARRRRRRPSGAVARASRTRS